MPTSAKKRISGRKRESNVIRKKKKKKKKRMPFRAKGKG